MNFQLLSLNVISFKNYSFESLKEVKSKQERGHEVYRQFGNVKTYFQ